jgi:hypothetical protein
MFFRKDGAKMKNDLSDILNIDPDNLDVELLNQPTYFYRYSKELEEAKEEYEIEKDALELKDVEIDSEVRKSPINFGISTDTKITEKVVRGAVVASREYDVARRKMLEAKKSLGLAQAAVNALHQRKDVLSDLVRLHGQNYFATPHVDETLAEKKNRMQKQKQITESEASDRVKKINRRRKES